MTPTIEQAAALAWDLVKDDDDPLFQDCQIDHRNTLVYLAQNVKATGLAATPFEQKVKAVLLDPEQAIAEIKAKLGLPQTLPAVVVATEAADAVVDPVPLATMPPEVEESPADAKSRAKAPAKTKRGK